MMLRWGLLLLWGQLLVGCATTRLVRLDLGDGAPIVHAPHSDAQRVALDKAEFATGVVALARDVRPSSYPLQDARRLWGVPPRSGSYLYEVENRRVISLQDGEEATRGLRLLEPSSASDELTLAYGRWCGRRSKPGDCLHLLDEGPLLGGDGKYVLAMAIAMDSVWDETAEALKGMADPQAVLATVTSAMTMYMMLWVMPEPASGHLC
ncbi:hypothetical protein [Archangium sp.]|uniref:SitA5 family polymorphic toxin n=1 Tax=Archangium sp. TaxID=1872627 RepID=UPI003899F42F